MPSGLEARLSQYVKDGKLYPSEKDLYLNMLSTDEGQAMKLSEKGEDGKETKSALAEQVFSMIESRKSVIELGERTLAPSPEDVTQEAADKEVGAEIGKRYMAGRKSPEQKPANGAA